MIRNYLVEMCGALYRQKIELMAKEKEGKAKNTKTAPTMNLKEKRAAKAAKKNKKSSSSGSID